jgi:hypothetical protein
MPFEDDEKDLERENPQETSKIKIKGQKPVASPLAQARDFQGLAKEVHERSQELNERAINLSKKFIEIMKDTTLAENKGGIAKNFEGQIVSDLANLGMEINNDQTKDEGEGSIGLIVLLFKTVISQRNRINSLEYKLQKLEKNFSIVQSRDLEKPPSDKK